MRRRKGRRSPAHDRPSGACKDREAQQLAEIFKALTHAARHVRAIRASPSRAPHMQRQDGAANISLASLYGSNTSG